MTAITVAPFPCFDNTTFLNSMFPGTCVIFILLIGWFIAIVYLLANIFCGGKEFKSKLRISSPIQETIYGVLICVVLISTCNIWGDNFIFKRVQFEELENVELIEEIYPDSMRADTDKSLVIYREGLSEYNISYNKAGVGVKTVTDDMLCIEHYKGEYSVFLITATFDYFILHVPKEG